VQISASTVQPLFRDSHSSCMSHPIYSDSLAYEDAEARTRAGYGLCPRFDVLGEGWVGEGGGPRVPAPPR